MAGSKWDFRTVQKTGGKAELVPLTVEQRGRISAYEEALLRAGASTVSNPPYSKYFVKESIGRINGPMFSAGNIEYGWCQAIHGEESAVSAFRAMYGRDRGNVGIVLGISAGNPDHIANPCGNCRDIMLEDLGEDFEIVSGAPEGGVAVVVKMSDFLFKHPVAQDLESGDRRLELNRKVRQVFNSCIGIENDAYSPGNVHPERRYFAMIEMDGDNFFCGAHDVMCEYHPIYALRDAVRQARRYRSAHIKEVYVVGPSTGHGKFPHVMYKDRQHLLELNLQGELMAGEERNPPVHLLTFDASKIGHFSRLLEDALIGAWRTSVKEWLPFPFSPRNFGPEFLKHLTDYYQKKSCNEK